MAVLLRSQDVPRPADLQIPHGDLNAGAQLREFPDGLETLFRLLPQHFVPLVHEERKGGAIGAADAPADLVKLGKAQPVRVMDDHGIGIGDIQPRFDDGGGY